MVARGQWKEPRRPRGPQVHRTPRIRQTPDLSQPQTAFPSYVDDGGPAAVPDFLAARLHNVFGQNLDPQALVARARAAVLDTVQARRRPPLHGRRHLKRRAGCCMRGAREVGGASHELSAGSRRHLPRSTPRLRAAANWVTPFRCTCKPAGSRLRSSASVIVRSWEGSR